MYTKRLKERTQSIPKAQRVIEECLMDLHFPDPHSHIVPGSAASKTLADILGYHYYTELAHSVGLPREAIERAGIEPAQLVEQVASKLPMLRNMPQIDWLSEIMVDNFDFDEPIGPDNWQRAFDTAQKKLDEADWETQVIEASQLTHVMLTNDFDDPLDELRDGFFLPCLRTDDLVFHWNKPEVRERLKVCSGVEVVNLKSLREALGNRFEFFFREKGGKACAISTPRWFKPRKVDEAEANDILQKMASGEEVNQQQLETVASVFFWEIAEKAGEYDVPFDLMIGVTRGVYKGGVYQGQDLFSKSVSLEQYHELFNAFPSVVFPISVLGSTSNQELVAHSWIFPNVYVNGHWWYSNLPHYIGADASARLQGTPLVKNCGYYSDMYKLEFGRPKFKMYLRLLAEVLYRDFFCARGFDIQDCGDLAKQLLIENPNRIFKIDS